MAINFLDDRFYQRPRNIFSQMGATTTDNAGAKEALNLFGDYRVDVRPFYEKVNGEFVESNMRGMYLPGRNNDVRIGEVKGRYIAVQPADIAAMWDSVVKLPINAIGAAGSVGEKFFLSSPLGQMDIDGDVMDVNLLLLSPMTGKGAITCRVTPVSLKCTNMIVAAIRRSTVTIRIPHTGKVLEGVRASLSHLKQDIALKQKLVEADLRKMYATPATDEKLEWFMGAVYELPKEPNRIGDPSAVERREREYEVHTTMVKNRRATFLELVNGKATGYDLFKFRSMGTVLSAAGELEQYRRGEADEDKRALNAAFGKRAEKISEIYDAALALAN